MDEITFEEILFHYERKLRAAADEIQSLRNQLNRTVSALDSVWTGLAASSCQNKLETIDRELNKASGELSEAFTKLFAAKELLAKDDDLL